MSNDDDTITEKDFDQYVRNFGKPMPEKVKGNVLEEIKRKQIEQVFEKSDEQKSAPESESPDMEF